jgi:hypothetical protein
MEGELHLEPAGSGRRDLVVVPHEPGPLLSLEPVRRQRSHDDLDALIDDLFPDVDERSGWFDAVLLGGGAALLVWAWIGRPPTIVMVLGFVAVVLGGVLPLRAAWRRGQERKVRRHREDLLGRGVLMDVSSTSATRLVVAYEALLAAAGNAPPELGEPAMASGHFALVEVSSLLNGRAPSSAHELAYLDRRSAALAELADALLPIAVAGPELVDEDSALDTDALLEAHDELDQVAPFNSVTRLEDLAAEARRHHRDRS